MYDFIVLGLVPGTQIQITFELWLQFAGALVIGIILLNILRSKALRNALVALSFAVAVNRKPKLANQTR